jgi:hypothetical protein
MTARPARALQPRPGFRVVGGTEPLPRPLLGPFLVFGAVLIAAMTGIAMARTSLDAGAFQLAELDRAIAEQEARTELLTLEIARLESPSRIGPAAEEMGLVVAVDRETLLVEAPVGSFESVATGQQS